MSLAVTFIGSQQNNTNVNPQTMNGISWGLASGYGVVAIHYGTAGIHVPTSVTIGGVAATRLGRATFVTSRCLDIWYAPLGVGSTATVSVNFGGNTNNCAFGIWRVDGIIDPADFSVDPEGAATVYGQAMAARPGAVGIAAITNSSGNVATFTEPSAKDYASNNTLSTTFRAEGGHESIISGTSWTPNITSVGTLSNYVAVVFNPSISADVATVLTGFAGVSQALSVTESLPSTIDQTLPGFTQDFEAFVQSTAATITQTLFGFTQEIDAAAALNIAIAQTLPGFTQEIDVSALRADIAQTLPGLTQEIDVSALRADIAQTLPGFTQEIDVSALRADIAQTLPGFTQEIDANNSPPIFTTVNQTMLGISAQDLEVIEKFVATVAQTLPGFVQEIDVTETLSSSITTSLGLFTPTLDNAFLGHIDAGTYNGAGTIGTFGGFNFGAADPNLYAVAEVAYGTAGIRVPNTVSINGVAATRLCRSTGIATRANDLWFAAIPSGGVGNVVVSFAGGNNNGSVAVWTIKGKLDVANIAAVTDTGTAFNPTFGSRNGSVGIVAGSGTAGSTFTFIDPAVGDFTGNNIISTTFRYAGAHEAVTANSWSPNIQNTGSLTDWSAAIFMPLVNSAPALSQVVNVSVSTGAAIATSLAGFSQEIDVSTINATIDQTLRGITQDYEGTVVEPPNVIAHLVDTVLPTFVQEIDVHTTPNADIDQTLLGISQEFDAFTIGNNEANIDQMFLSISSQAADVTVEMVAIIDQTLAGFAEEADIIVEIDAAIDQTFTGFAQELDATVEMDCTIDQTLVGFAQEADVVEEFDCAIDQTLPGFGQQEIDAVVEMDCAVDQTLPGFGQEIDVVVEMNAIIDQELLGFGQQEIDVDVTAIIVPPNADIAAELLGFNQRMDVRVLTHGQHPRVNPAAVMPSKDPPIHPGELELFRRMVYARAVDAMVPPTVIARQNLTTTRHPTSRPSVNRTPLGKPKQ